MIRGASHRTARRQGVLVLLVACSLVVGELAFAGHVAGLDHVEHGDDASALVAGCSICDLEAKRPAKPRPSPLHGAITPVPLAAPLPVTLEADEPRSVPLAGRAAPRAPPTGA